MDDGKMPVDYSGGGGGYVKASNWSAYYFLINRGNLPTSRNRETMQFLVRNDRLAETSNNEPSLADRSGPWPYLPPCVPNQTVGKGKPNLPLTVPLNFFSSPQVLSMYAPHKILDSHTWNDSTTCGGVARETLTTDTWPALSPLPQRSQRML